MSIEKNNTFQLFFFADFTKFAIDYNHKLTMLVKLATSWILAGIH